MRRAPAGGSTIAGEDGAAAKTRSVLGIDEAGRGSVVGPLVVGGFLLPEARLDELRPLGVRDSKLLTPAARAIVYDRLPGVGRRMSVSFAPSEVDAAVRHGELNLLEARGFARLIRRCRPDVVYVDACDPVAERFGRMVAGLAGRIAPVRAQHQADRSVPVVGAASIVAKVRRDRAIAHLATKLERNLGSGYPSDERTVACVREALAGVDRKAPWIRHSWSTAERLKPAPRLEPLERFER